MSSSIKEWNDTQIADSITTLGVCNLGSYNGEDIRNNAIYFQIADNHVKTLVIIGWDFLLGCCANRLVCGGGIIIIYIVRYQ